MKLILRSIFAMALLCLLASCSKDDELVASEIDMIELAPNLEVEGQFAAAILDEINLHRESMGLSDLQPHTDSESQAVDHSKYMASKHQISHDNFFKRSDYLKSKGADKVSENVAFGYDTAEEVVAAWLKSPGHREALEGDFTHSGIAVVKTETGVTYFTEIFVKE